MISQLSFWTVNHWMNIVYFLSDAFIIEKKKLHYIHEISIGHILQRYSLNLILFIRYQLAINVNHIHTIVLIYSISASLLSLPYIIFWRLHPQIMNLATSPICISHIVWSFFLITKHSHFLHCIVLMICSIHFFLKTTYLYASNRW